MYTWMWYETILRPDTNSCGQRAKYSFRGQWAKYSKRINREDSRRERRRDGEGQKMSLLPAKTTLVSQQWCSEDTVNRSNSPVNKGPVETEDDLIFSNSQPWVRFGWSGKWRVSGYFGFFCFFPRQMSWSDPRSGMPSPRTAPSDSISPCSCLGIPHSILETTSTSTEQRRVRPTPGRTASISLPVPLAGTPMAALCPTSSVSIRIHFPFPFFPSKQDVRLQC